MSRGRVDPALDLDDDAKLAGAAQVASEWIQGAADRPAAPCDPPPRRRITIDTSTADELDRRGEAIHPGTGLLLRRDKATGAVTAHNRATGEVFDVPNAPPARPVDPRRTAWTTGVRSR